MADRRDDRAGKGVVDTADDLPVIRLVRGAGDPQPAEQCGRAGELARMSRLLDQESLLLAFNDTFSTFVLISLCGFILALFFRRARLQQR